MSKKQEEISSLQKTNTFPLFARLLRFHCILIVKNEINEIVFIFLSKGKTVVTAYAKKVMTKSLVSFKMFTLILSHYDFLIAVVTTYV